MRVFLCLEMDITISTKAKAKMIIFCYNYRENQESKEIMEVLREPYDFLLEGGHLYGA
jgi:hypothetical protein